MNASPTIDCSGEEGWHTNPSTRVPPPAPVVSTSPVSYGGSVVMRAPALLKGPDTAVQFCTYGDAVMKAACAVGGGTLMCGLVE